ncbi:MAG: hypothetical protein ACJ75G_12965 [Gaiellaceae bacterium]
MRLPSFTAGFFMSTHTIDGRAEREIGGSVAEELGGEGPSA